MIYNKEFECLDPQKMHELQLNRICDLVRRVYENVPFYRKRLDDAGIFPDSIQTFADFEKIPFTTKDDLRQTYPYGLLATPKENIVEIHMSSGTTGIPVVDAYTQNDLNDWAEGMARTLAAAGATTSDTVQNAFGYGLFTGGLGVHYGSKRLGAVVLPISAGNTEKQLAMMQDFETAIITCTPSYALYLSERARQLGIDLKGLNLKAGCFGAEPWSENMRKQIEAAWGIKAFDIYGLTEITGPGVAFECEEQNGLHLNEDMFFPEIINPETGAVLPPGEKGELVITTITKQGTPLLRYRTRDITYIIPEQCPCGRTTRRMHRLFGRTDDLLIIRGVNVFPTQIENALIEAYNCEPNYLIIVSRNEATHLDEIELQVEVNETQFTDVVRDIENLHKKIEGIMKSKLGIAVKVRFVAPNTIARFEGKSKRVIDNRKI
ncbi:MAG: phenylacetate--CoA ligase [Spirochaetaceae bacterium]|nr:phenylacetate--CoA ligase [Spirochaetaceae bacterium]